MAVDSTGKVLGRSAQLEDAVKIHRGQSQGAGSQRPRAIETDAENLVDTVQLGLGKAISDNIDPQEMKSERAARVARLKELVANQEYSVPSEQIASAFSDEISQEIQFLRSLPQS